MHDSGDGCTSFAFTRQQTQYDPVDTPIVVDQIGPVLLGIFLVCSLMFLNSFPAAFPVDFTDSLDIFGPRALWPQIVNLPRAPKVSVQKRETLFPAGAFLLQVSEGVSTKCVGFVGTGARCQLLQPKVSSCGVLTAV